MTTEPKVFVFADGLDESSVCFSAAALEIIKRKSESPNTPSSISAVDLGLVEYLAVQHARTKEKYVQVTRATLAQALGVDPRTVSNAYERLRRDRIIEYIDVPGSVPRLRLLLDLR